MNETREINFLRPSDSILTNLFARFFSVRITPIIAKTPIKPLQVTIAGLLIGLIAAWIGSNPYWLHGIAAATLMEVSHILDCVDGELARLTGRGSPFAANLDPISDRIKDIFVVYASFLHAEKIKIFGHDEFWVFTIAFFALGVWLLYVYVVDAYLNPARKKMDGQQNLKGIYIGLYDLFIYGSIAFWIANKFEYFIFYVLGISLVGISIQLRKLKLFHTDTSRKE